MTTIAFDHTLQKRHFWQQFHTHNFLAEQRKILNRLLDGGERSTRYQITSLLTSD